MPFNGAAAASRTNLNVSSTSATELDALVV
jgi:hypothetical protein